MQESLSRSPSSACAVCDLASDPHWLVGLRAKTEFMAKFFVLNVTNPKPAASVHGTVVDTPGTAEAPAAYAAIHPVAPNDVITVIPASLTTYVVNATFVYPSAPSPAIPPDGT
jgi:hypothetical protein